MADRIDGIATDLKKVEHRLETVEHGLQKVEYRLESVDHRMEGVEHRMERVEHGVATLSQSMDERFTQVDAAVVEQRHYTEFAYEQLDAKMDSGFARLDAKMDAGFARVERKLDRFIDVQMTTNDLVDRRLRALESGRRRPKRR